MLHLKRFEKSIFFLFLVNGSAVVLAVNYRSDLIRNSSKDLGAPAAKRRFSGISERSVAENADV